jgi:tetratricopeptide (TPR) repeat protein
MKKVNQGVVPGDIQAVLVARLDQLAREVRETIQTASILGREFEVTILTKMLREEENVLYWVGEAEKAAIWAPLQELRYIFSHGLLRDAAYAMQMQARRRELHALAVEALEVLYGSDLKNRYAELGYHAEHAQIRQKAQQYYILAAKVAADLYQNSPAIEYYTRALAHTLIDDLDTKFTLLVERVLLFHRIGQRMLQAQDLDSLEALANQLGKPQHLAKAKMLRAQYFFITSDYPGTIGMSEEVIRLSRDLGEPDLALGVYPVWSHALLRSGRLEEALSHAVDALALARQTGRRVEEGKALTYLGLIALESKEPALGQTYLEEAVAIARETNERVLESRAIANLANSAAYIQKNYGLARTYYERANALNLELGDRYAQGIALGNIGWVCGMLGDFPAAQRYHEQSLVIAREVGNVYQETYTLMNLSRIAEIQGKAKEAVRYARDAVQLSKKAGDKAAEAWSYLYLGHAHALMHEVEQAKLAFEESLRIRSELGQVALATEPLAGLILLALEVQDIPRAKTLTDEVMHFLSAGATLDATEEPLRVYLACYNVLERMQDPRANQILVSAKQVLEEQTSKLKDEESRSMYIRNVPWRQAIEQAWLNAEEKS